MALDAVTLNIDELPEMIEVGLAVILTFGVGFGVTVTVVLADDLPPLPIATAVYVVVAVGLTSCVPPLDCKEYVLPSVPLIVTCVASTAATFRVDELSIVIEAGFAVMITVGNGVGVTTTVVAAETFPPTPVAIAVYIVVFVGLTACVPPLGWRTYVLPSDPITFTCVAPKAVIVRMEELPAVIEVGMAVIETVGAGMGITVSVALAELVPPGPAATAV